MKTSEIIELNNEVTKVSETVFVNLKNDYAFKIVFGNQEYPEFLQILLQNLIPERKITSLTFLPTEAQSGFESGKRLVYDILCHDEKGVFVIEMQRRRYIDYIDRVIIYSAGLIRQSLKAGEAYSEALSTYVISILDYELNLEGDDEMVKNEPLRTAAVRINGNPNPLSNAVKYIFLQLPIVKTIRTDSPWIEKFAYTIENSGTFIDIPEELRGEDYFVRLLDFSRFSNMKRFTIDFSGYDSLEYDERQHESEIKTALMDGRKQGAIENTEQIIKNAAANGFSAEQISLFLNLPKEQILKIMTCDLQV